MVKSKHVFKTKRLKPQAILKGGSRAEIHQGLFPILKGLSLYLLRLKRNGIREPHWHPNAHELAYCVSGRYAVRIFGPDALHENFLLTEGEIAFIPKGYLHMIENIGPKEGLLLIGFNHEMPEDIGISAGVSSMPNDVLAATFETSPQLFSRFRKFEKDALISERRKGIRAEIPPKAGKHRYKLEANDPQVDADGGTIRLAKKEFFSVLDKITLFDLRLSPGGIREPHWHPNAAEMDYVVKGRARMIILSPDGERDEFIVEKGDIVFIPPAYFHYIENIGKGEMHFAIYFNHESPEDIGVSGSLGAFSNDILGSIFCVDPKELEKLPKPQADCFVARRPRKK